MELVGEGGGWSLGESGVGTKVRLEVELNSRGEVLSLTDSKLLIRGTQVITERTSLNWLFGCVLGFDPNFNLGPFDVTVTMYRHMLLQKKN